MYSGFFKVNRFSLVAAAALATLAVSCADESELNNGTDDETLEQVALDAGTVRVDASTPSTPGADAGSPDGGAAPAGASFCEVLAIIKPRCQACHDSEPIAGAPMALVTYEDFLKPAVLTAGKKVYEVTQTRMHDTRRPMPPRGVRPAAELAVIDSWVAAGAPAPATPCK